MHTLTRLAAVAALAALPLVALPAAASAQTPPPPGSIIFEDDFAGSSLDTGKWSDWSQCTYDATAAYGLNACDGDDRVTVGSGVLSIPATPTQATSIRTPAISTYGVYSVWAKTPTPEGYWPTIWTLNNTYSGRTATNTDPVGEVDIMETWTKFSEETPGLSKALGHTWTGSGTTDYHSPDNTCETTGTRSAAFHKYTAKIAPGQVTYYVDDVQCGQTYDKDTGKTWGLGPDQTRENWLILTNAIGDAGGQQAAPTVNSTFLVDRVEVRALDEPSPAIVDGETYSITNTCGDKALAAPSGGGDAQLVTATPSGTDDLQKWLIEDYTNGKWKLKNVSSGKTANVFYASTSNGATVGQFGDYGGSNAEWDIIPGINGKYEIRNVNSGKNLDVPSNNTAAGIGIDQWTPNTSCGQTWKLVDLP